MKEVCCDLEVDVNGEETFFLNKKLLASCSSTLRKLCRNMKDKPKIIFHDFPGGADGFELVLRFCYSNPRISFKITPFNAYLLQSAADYLKMEDLAQQTLKYIEGYSIFKQCLILNTFLLKKLVQTMLSQGFDHSIVSLFLFNSKEIQPNKRRAVEIVIELLFSLDQNIIPCKSLIGLLGSALRLNVGRSCMEKLELMVSFKLDEAKVDDLLVSSQPLMRYDVNLVLRLVKSFVIISSRRLMNDDDERMKKVGRLVDLYMREVSPDPYLGVSKFMALAMALPDSARDSHDSMCQAIDLYLEVHGNCGKLSEEEKMELCSVLNYEMVSPEALVYFLQNKYIPKRMLIDLLASHEHRLKGFDQSLVNSDLRALFDSVVRRAKSWRHGDNISTHCKMGEGLRMYVCESRKLKKKMRNYSS